MDKNIFQLISFLKQAGYEKHASKLERQHSPEKVEFGIDPLSLAVSLGILNPSVLETLKEEGHDEDLKHFRHLLKELEETE